MLSLPQNPRLAWVDDEGMSLCGLKAGVGADDGARLGVEALPPLPAKDGRERAFMNAGDCEFVLALSGWTIFMVEALSASNSRLNGTRQIGHVIRLPCRQRMRTTYRKS